LRARSKTSSPCSPRQQCELREPGPDPRGGGSSRGSSAVVFVSDDVVVRISRQRAAAPEIRRSQALVDALPVLPFEVPRSVGEPVQIDGYVAFPVRRLHGDPHPAGEGDPARLRDLLDAIHSVDVSRFRDQRCAGEPSGLGSFV
jgi:hypothetical protein